MYDMCLDINCHQWDTLIFGSLWFRLLCVYRGKHLSQGVLSVEDEDTDNTDVESDIESDEVHSYDVEGVENNSVVPTIDQAVFKVDHTFTVCGARSDAVGRCFVEV
jgi:hypothetical protein